MDYSHIKLIEDLPISKYEAQIASELRKQGNLIIIGETGSGKTTQIPLILLKELSQFQDLTMGKIAITEPRRIAATSVASYVAQLIGENLGQTIGYKIRFNQITSDSTKVIFMTDGILLREIQLDPLLLNYSVVMVDEAHERNINSDFLIGLLVDIQQQRTEQELVPLKIIVTSATLEKDKFIDFFHKESREELSIIEVPGKLFNVTSFYERKEVYDYTKRAAEIVQDICTNNSKTRRTYLQGVTIPQNGDILIFMPGKGEIERTKMALLGLKNFADMNLDVITIHGDLPIEEQNKIFKQTSKRKVVIATNIAETSLTVPGIVFVIDSGLIKVMEFNPHAGINSLITKPHAQKGLEQRKGRAGRICEGFYFGLYTEQSLKLRPEFPEPEILRSSLTQVILVMKRIGINNIYNFKFIDHPDDKNITASILELKRLGALDRNENITTKGITMASLPIEPRLANLILEAHENYCVETICTIASFLELKPVFLQLTEEEIYKNLINEKLSELEGENDISSLSEDILYALKEHSVRIFEEYQRAYKKFVHKSSDLFTLLNIFNSWIQNEKRPEWAISNFLSIETLDEATNIREELLDIAKQNNLGDRDKNTSNWKNRVEKTLVSAFKFNLLARQTNGLYRNLVTKEKNIRIHNSSVLSGSKPKYAIAFEIIEIQDIDSKPKLSAKFLHALDDLKLKLYFPKLYKQELKQQKLSKRHKKLRFKNKRMYRKYYR
ncbi:MAG: hypothetical protein KatS3mg084_0188 [Candidatus Dojkabacteria bacterium]|nr:MAG: hypothetical protein KatS3mg084_0188 [Candidatus Dojkabacteria bacterium]